jgi:hypothetical protein
MEMAMALEKPVITFDPHKENNNTVVAGGSASYPDNLDASLNAVFLASPKYG